jgi:signal transduction histidine kinase
MLGAKLFGRLDERRVRYVLAAFFLALAVPAALLIAQAYSQLKWEAFRNNQIIAEELAERIDTDLRAAIAAEEARSFGDYAFLVVEGDEAANFVQRSPLSAYPVASALPGAIGYFQVDAEGNLTTPLLPAAEVDASSYGIAADERNARLAVEASIGDVLAVNRLVQRPEPEERELQRAVAPSRRDAAADAANEAGDAALTDQASNAPPAAQTQAAFDRLASSAPASEPRPAATRGASMREPVVEEMAKAEADEQITVRTGASLERAAQVPVERLKRTEQALVPEPQRVAASADLDAQAGRGSFRIRTFESELDPLELGLLDTGHVVVFRNAWRDGQRYIQGVLVDRDAFVAGAVGAAFRASSLAGMSDLGVVYQGRAIANLGAQGPRAYSAADLTGSLLHRVRLSPPFGDLELAFSVNRLPRAPGSMLLAWVSVTLAALLAGGFFFMYRFAIGQMRLTRQQQDFVSAVSHELKTPLTSIRMYGEMLKAGWADEAKKQTYYDYIHSESERLSRLIENVLQLARLTRSSQRFDLKRVAVAELLDLVRSKIDTQAARAGFTLQIRDDTPSGTDLTLDADCFTQIVINLVDNALKFSAGADRKAVDIESRLESGGRVLFTVRDYGPGIPKGQMKKIFELFYRPANELTRETVGTGIGLALVRELASAMGGRVDVRNREPGAEFRLSFPAGSGGSGA